MGEEFLIVALEDISGEKRRGVLERTFFHDILNTCGGVQGLADLLAEPDNDAASEAELKQDLRRLSGHAIDQIASQRQLLAAERGELALQLKPVELRPFLNDIVTLYRHHDVAEGREIELAARGARNRPDGSHDPGAHRREPGEERARSHPARRQGGGQRGAVSR